MATPTTLPLARRLPCHAYSDAFVSAFAMKLVDAAREGSVCRWSTVKVRTRVRTSITHRNHDIACLFWEGWSWLLRRSIWVQLLFAATPRPTASWTAILTHLDDIPFSSSKLRQRSEVLPPTTRPDGNRAFTTQRASQQVSWLVSCSIITQACHKPRTVRTRPPLCSGLNDVGNQASIGGSSLLLVLGAMVGPQVPSSGRGV
jgi:hypothetical protein